MPQSRTHKPQKPLAWEKQGLCSPDQMQWHHLWGFKADI